MRRMISITASFSGSMVSTVAIIVWDDWHGDNVPSSPISVKYLYWLVFLEVQFRGIPLQYTVYCVGIFFIFCVCM